eukprot:gb/GECG01016704.1/.p1 GENE.gb/GECG01016704.1/~~gb/GECG01016704.1/.p1  ORF type:complete len:585 (+),score=38.92 gb/GECG01016704.1/:1-1755(+)
MAGRSPQAHPRRTWPWKTMFVALVAVSASSYNIPKGLVWNVLVHYVPNLAALSTVGLLSTLHPVAPVDYLAEETVPNFLKSVQDRYFDQSPPDPRVVYPNTAPTILNVPILERIEFFIFRFWNFFALQFINMPFNLWYSQLNYQTTPVRDDELATLFTHHWPSFFLRSLNYTSPTGTAEGFPEFVEALDISSRGGRIFEWYYAQFPGMATFEYTQNSENMFYGAGSFIILRRPKGSPEELEPYAIELFGECMNSSNKNDGNHPRFPSIITRPGDPAWDASKTFLIHGAQHYYVLAEHSMSHFPFDIINAATKDRRLVPLFHPIQSLLQPHFRFTLSLNDFVMNSFATSILLNDHLVHCFDASGPAIFQLTQEYTKEFSFSNHKVEYFPPRNPSNITIFLLEYRPIIGKFVRRVVEEHRSTGEFRDVYMQKWADHIAAYVPGFPNGEQIQNEAVMIEALTEIIFDLSVHHSTQHWNYHTSLEMKKRPWRIRHRPPLSKEEHWDWDEGSHTSGDMFTYSQTEIMFFFPGPYNSLKETKYSFSRPKVNDYAREFIQDLKAKDKKLEKEGDPVYQLVPFDKMGPSIDC